MNTVAQSREHASAPVNAKLQREEKLKLLRDMVRIRQFEMMASRKYAEGKYIGGFLHLYNGQESVAVGTCSLMGPNDHVITAYRDHGHALAVGMSMNECMAELYGRATGCSKGKGGSMHFFAPDKNYWGGHGIVAGQTPLGLGLAYGLKYKGLTGSCMCFMGDGAVNQGVFYESLNLASLFDLPVIYIIENNQYSMGTSLERSSAFRNCLAERAEGFAIDWDTCNGESIYEVRAKAQVAIERAHRQSRPTVLEISTYRHFGHSVADVNRGTIYRTPEEIERYIQSHDPIALFKAQLVTEELLTEEVFEAIEAEARTEAAESAKFAEESPIPGDSAITEDVYFEVDRATQAGRTGLHFFN